jgi:RNA polymerase sigma-70 factor (ECF subfamily)
MKSPARLADPHDTPGGAGTLFATTHWSVVLAAGRDSSSPLARDALERLCRTYWPPVFAYVRRLGHGTEESRDLTQAFFEDLLTCRSFATASPGLGRFRSYLLGALKHFLADAHDHARAQKRGGNCEILSLDALGAEETYAWEPASDSTPERLFERRWALTLMARALDRLEEECRLTGKAHVFGILRGFLSDGVETKTYPDAASELSLTEANVRMTVSRLRRRYGELVQAEVAETLGTHAELEDELRHLQAVLRGN